MHSRSVRIFMEDGTVFGIQHAEIVNRTLQAVLCPRNRLGEFQAQPMSTSPGVYMLFGQSEDGEEATYVGQTQNVGQRLISHVTGHIFWNRALIFVFKDENVVIPYLESRLIQLSIEAARYKVINKRVEGAISISRPDKAAMEELITDMNLLLGVLGFRVLEPIIREQSPASRFPSAFSDIAIPGQGVRNGTSAGPSNDSVISLSDFTFSFQSRGVRATGKVTDEGFVVQKGSRAALKTGKLVGKNLELRDNLQRNGTWVPEGGTFLFTRDFLFSTPSAAASVIAGNSRSGNRDWKVDGVTLGEMENKILDNTLNIDEINFDE